MKRNCLIFDVVCGALLLLCSCNNDVFIDELNASQTELQMNKDGDSATVNLSKADWMVIAVTNTEDSDEKNQFFGKLYDNSNQLIYKYDIPLSQFSVPWMKMVCSENHSGFTICRTDNTTLKINVEENLSDSDFEFTILVGDHYKVLPINIIQAASAGYAFDHITYEYIPNSFKIDTKWYRDSITVNSTLAVTVNYLVFSGIKHTFTFSSNEERAFSYLNDTTRIDTPILLADSAITYASEKIYYRQGIQNGELPFGETQKKIVIPTGKSEILRAIEFEQFDANYTLYVRNRETNGLQSIHGTLHCDTPTGENYDIFVNHKIQR